MKLPLSIVSLAFCAATVSGCTTYRAATAKTWTEDSEINACMGRSALIDRFGSPDRALQIPTGGVIEVHDVLIRPENNPGTNAILNAAVTALSFGGWEVITGGWNAFTECETSDAPGSGAKTGTRCDYKKLRIFAHYADPGSNQIACWEMDEVWVGTQFNSIGDESACPIEYKSALADLMDTSEFPAARYPFASEHLMEVERAELEAQLRTWSPTQFLVFMANDHQMNCPN